MKIFVVVRKSIMKNSGKVAYLPLCPTQLPCMLMDLSDSQLHWPRKGTDLLDFRVLFRGLRAYVGAISVDIEILFGVFQNSNVW